MFDPNGATRQIGIMLVMLIVSWIASMRIAKGRTKRYTRLHQIYPLVFLAGVMALVAYEVRTPCRPDYYIGCGVNLGTYLGFGLAVAMLIFGLVMALAWKMPVGWLVAAIAVYYGEYMQQFYHVLSLWWRLGIVAVAVSLALPWAASAVRWTRSTASRLR